MRVGVTGASGMLGTALIDELANKHEVFATSRSKGLEKDGVQWECFDLTNSKHLNKWLDNTTPDVVIHCAALVDVDRCEKNVSYATKLHVDTTKALVNYLDCNNNLL